jgi:hypothetical protein
MNRENTPTALYNGSDAMKSAQRISLRITLRRTDLSTSRHINRNTATHDVHVVVIHGNVYYSDFTAL